MRLYAAIFLATLSTAFSPLPEETALLAAGYAARAGEVALPGAVAAGLAAVLVGDTVAYLVGRLLLARLLRTRVGRRLVPERWRAWGEAFVARRGVAAVVAARFLVGLRGFVYFAVGASRVPFGRFLAVDAAAGVIEVGLLVGLGYAVGDLRARGEAPRFADGLLLVLLALTLVAPVLVRVSRRSRPAA